ncbi:hypothetical protein [Cohaesibacter intestini]|uniref:hypothetical protein n=1 Tax=Cohaesibacter intestini TaxID=2211145 RepID=UPI000DE80602|nr:hypothetical protein [Cohaesibacter intestini]
MQRVNPLKLNKLQLRTLVLLQILGRTQPDEAWGSDGSVTIPRLPHPHGDHFHVGEFTVHAADASGFTNRGVWAALARKGMVKSADVPPVVLTKEGLDYLTGLDKHFLEKSDH